MKKLLTREFKFFAALLLLVAVTFGCSKLKELTGDSDRLYFCERYDAVDGEINEAEKFTTGTLTVMVKLSKPIGVTDVDINVTDKETGNVVETYPYTVSTDMDYIYFYGVKFEEPGEYKVSCLKRDGSVIVSGEIEIID
ncbi:MAG: hypothetical protein A2W30_02915 [Ignavibacteria bacterium RBG_16_36_9]|nr:MAG: hypothetical protein A2W30_02915 [Ignavibacteria bacterium RBG_16_36_9]